MTLGRRKYEARTTLILKKIKNGVTVQNKQVVKTHR